MKRNGIAAAGNWIIDQVKMIDNYPEQDRLANILDQSQGNGGSPYNVLKDLARLGADFPLEAVGLVGKDAFGSLILSDCKSHGIGTSQLKTTTKAPTSYTDVMTVRSTGRRTFFHNRGANSLFGIDDIKISSLKVKIFHLGYLLLLDSLDAPDSAFGTKSARLLAILQKAGIKTSVDVVSEDSDRFQKIVTPALKYCDYCILNEFEAGKTTGFKIRASDGKIDPVALKHASGDMLNKGVREFVIIHFPEGAFARAKTGEQIFQPSLKLPKNYIAGTTGAGDAFCAGVLYGLHEDWELKQSLLAGVCAATTCLSEPTCSDGIQKMDACLALGKKFGFCKALVGV